MKTIPFALIFLFAISCISCKNDNTKYKWRSYYDKYFSTADKTALDSALLYIDEEIKENPKDKWSVYCYKLSIYSISLGLLLST